MLNSNLYHCYMVAQERKDDSWHLSTGLADSEKQFTKDEIMSINWFTRCHNAMLFSYSDKDGKPTLLAKKTNIKGTGFYYYYLD